MRTNVIMAALSVLAATSCGPRVTTEPRTEIMLRISASAEVRARTSSLRVRATTFDDSNAASKPTDIRVSELVRWPVDIPVYARDPQHLPRAFQLLLEAVDSADVVVADARVITTFARGTQRVLAMRLARCGMQPLGQVCESDRACAGSQCQTCTSDRCSLTPVIAGDTLSELDATLTPSDEEPTADSAGATPDRAAADGGRPPSRSDAGASDDQSADATRDGGKSSADADATKTDASAQPSLTTSWTPPELLETAAEDVKLPALAHNRAGDLALAWWQDNPEGFVWMRRFMQDGWDETPFRATGPSRPSEVRSPPYLGIDGQGVAQIFFLAGSPTSNGAPASGYWSPWDGSGESPVTLEFPQAATGNVALSSFPKALHVAEDGSAVMLLSNAPDLMGTALMLVNTSTQNMWGFPNPIGSFPSARAGQPANASNDVGQYVMVFGVAELLSENIQRLDATIGNGRTVLNRADLSLPEPLLGEPTVEMNTSGDVSVLCRLGTNPETPHLYALSYEADTARWVGPERVTEPAVSAADLTVLSTGQPLAIWAERNAQEQQLRLSRYDRTTQWSPPLTIGLPFALTSASDVSIASREQDELLITWVETIRQPDGTAAQALMASRSRDGMTFSEPSMVTSTAGELRVVGTQLRTDQSAIVIWLQTAAQTSTHDLYWSQSR